MKGYFLAGLWPISVSFPITLTRRNTRVSQVIMNAVSDAWPFSLPPAHLVCLHCCCLSLFYNPLVLQCFWLHLQQCCHFCRFNYLRVCFTAWLVVVTNVQARKRLSFALVSSKLIGQLFTFAIHGLVCMNVKGRLPLYRYFPLASTVLTRVDVLIKFCALQPPLHNRLLQKGL